jgi:predicted nucleic acid-binding protein
VAIIAISVNLFNLLPITPLDGGRLVEIALLSRWPRLRGLFALASVGAFVALAVWIKSPALWAIIALLVIGLRAQWQAARLQSAWQEGLPEGQQLAHLYDVMQQKLRLAVFTRQWALARAVFTHRLMHRPRWWESALTLLLMVAVWVGPGALAFQSLSLGGGSRHDERTAAQRSFDEFYTQFETSDEADETGARFLEPLQQRARALAPDDPRRIDVEVMQAGTLGEPARRQGIERILARGKSGLTWTVDALVRSELSALYLRVRELPAPERLAQLREGVDWAERVAPRALAPTLDARLRVAEAIDESGDTPAARDLLAQIRQRAVHADDCRCALGTVTRAQVWFHLSHGESDQALALLQQAPRTDRAGTDGRADSMDRAWALLLGGRTDEGLAKMREAAYWQPADAGWLVRILQPRTAKPRLVEPLDLAFALRSAGRDAEARELLATQGGRRCMAAPAGIGFHELMAPWQSERDRLLLETVRAACPAGAALAS